ncbi:hypothetical protein C8T65DRAFT_717938 [Cerioporus squamosus]|nr:hypothetical protein C8T65DRAFT_717938 [Cerioporus squamosus]
MHRALTHIDVLCHLLMYPVYEAEDEETDFAHRLELEADNRIMLLRCALACKQFRDPALDALWWRLDNLVPLLRLLPCFVPTKVQRKGAAQRSKDDTLYILKGEPSRDDWTRFQRYARRVRVLNYPQQAAVKPHIVAQLAKWNDGAPLLPGLKELTWRPGSPTDTAALLLGTRTLELLHLVLDCIELDDELQWLPYYEKMKALRDPTTRTSGDRSVERLLRTVAERTPRLRTLDLTTPVHPLCLTPIAAFTRIEHLSLRDTALDVDLLRSLSTLGELESLAINFLPVYDRDATAKRAPIHGFRLLSSLTLVARANDMTLFFDLVDPLEHLTSLNLEYPNDVPATSQTYREPLERMRNRGHAPQLASLSLEIMTRWRTRETMGDLVRPLLRWPTLQRVVVNAERSEYQVTEDDLERMACAWPGLNRLFLRWNARGSRAAGGAVPPLRALAHFAAHCPSLSELVLSYIDTDGPLPEPPKSLVRHRLKILSPLESYPVKDPKMVARYPSGWDQVLYWVGQWRAAWNKKLAQAKVSQAENVAA